MLKSFARGFTRLLLLLGILVIFASSVYADDPPSSTDLKFTYGASLRVRQEIWDNVVALDTNPTTQKDRNFFRFRLSVWGKADIGQHFDVFTKLTTEPKYYVGPYHPADFSTRHDNGTQGQYWDVDEIIFDNLYFSGKKLLNGKLDARIGRQDFLAPGDMYGEGFLLTDGTPGDGSRTFYFNAAKVRLNITPDNSVDFVYINDPETDIFLPSIHPSITGNALYVDKKKLLSTSDEQAFMLYSRNKLGQYFTFDPYYIHKTERTFISAGVNNPDLTLHTFGGRATFSANGWRAKAEIARQVGHYDTAPTGMTGDKRTGLGGYLFGGYKFETTPGKPEFDLGAVYLSGDNPNDSSKRTAWDPLFSRNPYWNELYIYTLINETAKKYSGPIPGYWTNMVIYMIKGKVNLAEKTSLTMTYQYLTAPESTPSTGTYALSSTEFTNQGKVRGQLPTAMLNHTFCKNVDGMVQLEYFIPGSFYKSNTENALFFRWQLNLKI
jgi:hypothetical protein